MNPSFDAAWTDAILATASIGGAVWTWRRAPESRLTPIGLGLLGAAASVGTFRLGGVAALNGTHDALSRAAGLVAIPLAALGVLSIQLSELRRRQLTRAALVLAVPLFVLAVAAPDALSRPLRTPVSGAALLATIAMSAKGRNPWGVVGPLLILVAGLAVVGDGIWLGLARDGWFHLMMATAAVCLARGRLHDPS